MLKQLAKLIFLLVAPLLLAGLWMVMVVSDVLARRKKATRTRRAAAQGAASPSSPEMWRPPQSASIVIPTWNGRELLEKHLPTVIAACKPADEVIVVDNASSDGTAEFVRAMHPQVRLLAMDRNYGFGGGCNAGARAARNRVVVMLNNDMRAAGDFLSPLLAGFTDANVFAVSSQIFFPDPSRRREETGLTTGKFHKGFVRVRHEIASDVDRLFPTFYAGGGSTAYDRDKFLELGGFDELFHPFYLEDTDLSYMAWKRGWKVLYQPASAVFHEHRATIGKHFSPEAIRAYLHKNYVMMVWKNIHRAGWLAGHFFFLYGHMALTTLGRPTETRTTVGAFLLALKQFPQVLRRRRREIVESTVGDAEVFLRARPSLFRERFPEMRARFSDLANAGREAAQSELGSRGASLTAGAAPALNRNGRARADNLPLPPPEAAEAAAEKKLNILFVSPYSVSPPLHGGAVFMLQGMRELAKRHNIFLLTFVDRPEEVASNLALEGVLAKVIVHVRRHRPGRPFAIRSSAEQTFYDPEFAALLERTIYLHDIDLIQFEYTQLAQYHLPLESVPQCLFEHDIYFRSVQRQLLAGEGGILAKAHEFVEWLRGMRYETRAAEKFDAIFTCHGQEERLLQSYLRHPDGRVVGGLRVAIAVADYPYPGGPRLADSLLFVGSFQHRPNVEGLSYFTREILPLIRAARPATVLHVVGSGAAPQQREELARDGIEFLGQVADIRLPLARYGVFVCPIRAGAGVRVKILEAFASGIPVVSTTLGAEGIEAQPGRELLIADSPAGFARACLDLLEDPQRAQLLAANARRLVESRYDWRIAGQRLERVYRELVSRREHSALPSARASETKEAAEHAV